MSSAPSSAPAMASLSPQPSIMLPEGLLLNETLATAIVAAAGGAGGANLSSFFQDANMTVLDCPEEARSSGVLFLEFWLEGVLNCVVAIVGFIANLLAAAILCKEDMRNSFNFLLIALIFMDSCYLIFAIIEIFRRCFRLTTVIHKILFPYLLYPLLNISMTASVFMTVGIALERYIAVHYPIDYSQAINSPEACKRRLFKYVAPVAVLSVLINVSKFFESTTVYSATFPNLNNHTIEGTGWSDIENQTSFLIKDGRDADLATAYIDTGIITTDFRQNAMYITYYQHWTRLIAIGIIPMLLIIYFNYKIYEDVKNRNRRQMSMSRHSSTETQSQARRKQEDNLAIVFMGIVLVFLICHSPRLVLSIYEAAVAEKMIECQAAGYHGAGEMALMVTSISHFLLVVNSSTNMILYIFLNAAFRLHFVDMVKWVGDTLCCCLAGCWKKKSLPTNAHQMSELNPCLNKAARNGSGSGGGGANGDSGRAIEDAYGKDGKDAVSVEEDVVENNGHTEICTTEHLLPADEPATTMTHV